MRHAGRLEFGDVGVRQCRVDHGGDRVVEPLHILVAPTIDALTSGVE